MVIFNVAKNGTSDERKANAGYGGEMLALFAEVGAGPMYIGESVTLEGEAGGADVGTVVKACRRSLRDT